MYDFMEDYSQSPYYHAKENIMFLTTDEEHAENVISGKEKERFNDFIFPVRDVDDKYYLSEKVAKYVLAGGTAFG